MTDFTSSEDPNESSPDYYVPSFLGGATPPASPAGAPPLVERRQLFNERRANHVLQHGRGAAPTSTLACVPLPRVFVEQDPPGSTCILSCMHQQELDISAGADGDVLNVITGQLDGASWKLLHLVLAMVRRALSQTGLVSGEQLVDRIAIVRANEKWNPAARMVVVGEVGDLAKITTVCEVALSALTQTAEQRSNLTIVDLDPVAQDAVRKCVEDAIESSRGCSFESPLIIQGANGNAVKLTGKVGRKKDKSDHLATPVEFAGRIGGFINFGKTNYFVLHRAEGGETRIDFEDKQLREESEPASPTTLCLVELARMNACSATCKVRTHKTLDAQGRAIYSFVSVDQHPN